MGAKTPLAGPCPECSELMPALATPDWLAIFEASQVRRRGIR